MQWTVDTAARGDLHRLSAGIAEGVACDLPARWLVPWVPVSLLSSRLWPPAPHPAQRRHPSRVGRPLGRRPPRKPAARSSSSPLRRLARPRPPPPSPRPAAPSSTSPRAPAWRSSGRHAPTSSGPCVAAPPCPAPPATTRSAPAARACRTASPRSDPPPPTRPPPPARPAPRRRSPPPTRSRSPVSSGTWRAIGATGDGAWRKATGKGVTVGVIDTGVDASHPDIAPNFSHALSRNFTHGHPQHRRTVRGRHLHRPGRRRRRRPRHATSPARSPRRGTASASPASRRTPRSSTSAPVRTPATSSSTRRSPPSPTPVTSASTSST